MEIQFIGAARTVTGSKHLITTQSGTNILLDCGLFQHKGADNKHLGFDPASIDCLILSHAHIDHSGNIPNLVRQGFKGKIFCTPGTLKLCKILLPDSAHIQKDDVAYINRKRKKKGLPPIQPLYSIEDVEQSLKQFHILDYGQVHSINREVELLFTNAGHLVGAAVINLTVRENNKQFKIAYTGDIGRPNDVLLQSPEAFPQADYVICESTYGNRLHEGNEEAEKKLLQIVVETCVLKKGKLIIPAFSVGRTQEIVYSLEKLKNQGHLPPIKIFVDSPLSKKATDIFKESTAYFNADIAQHLLTDPALFTFKDLYYIEKVEESKALNALKEPCIIISASGMMEAGRIKHHIRNNISKPENTVLIVGYCPPGTLGNNLLRGDQQVTIFGTEHEVKANIELISTYSAHADYKEMIEFLSCQHQSKIKQFFLVHGDYDAQVAFREKLILSGFHHIEIPEAKAKYHFN